MQLFIVGLLGLFTATLHAQVRISEFSAANTQSHPDIVDFSDYPDWIELENSSDTEVSLSGWFLSDEVQNPLKWGFPASAVLPARGHLVVWADGFAAVPGESHPRGYWPWRSFTTEGYHASFSLSSTGEAVVLTRVSGISEAPLITAGTPPPPPPAAATVWKYLDDGSDQGTQWRAQSFDDTRWASGIGQLGYGDGDETTLLDGGPDSSNRRITSYFRHTFSVADPSLMHNLSLRLMVDDGAVIYLNGQEIARQNIPAGDITHLTLAPIAIGGAAESAFTTITLPATALQSGPNTLAVEVHQSAVTSSDISFDLSLQGTSFTSATIADQYQYGRQIDDVSLGRHPDDHWVHYASPTPGRPNTGPTVTDLRRAGATVSFTPEAGLFPTAPQVSLQAASGTIRYTLDGSLPINSSPAYQEPLPLTTTTVVRARVFEEGKPNGAVATRTYFIGEEPKNLPFVSVVADPNVLFGPRIGIYYNTHEPLVSSGADAALGLRDVFKGKDAPGSLEFFAPGGQGGFRVHGGYRMGGENNWVHAQRALNFTLRGKYGDDAIRYDVFPGTRIPIHTSLVLRDGGDAWNKEMLRDGMWPSIVRGRMRADSYDYRASEVFINGAYWGIHNIRARWDDSWFFEHKRLNADQIDHLLYGHVTSGAVTLGVEKGDSADWLDMLDFLSRHDLNFPANLAVAATRINFDSFIDFIAAESYGINTSWHHNREFWRPRTPDGQWHWFLPDMDQTFRPSQLGGSVLGDMLARESVLVHLKGSTDFKNRLAQRFAAHAAFTFKPSRINSILEAMATEVEPSVPRHIERWRALRGMTNAGRAEAIQGIKDFAAARDASIHEEIRSQLGLPDAAVELSLAVLTPEAGRILVNGVAVDPGSLRLFPNIPFVLTAEPAPGFRFAEWTGVSGPTTEPVTTTTVAGPTAITAAFTPSGETVIGGTLARDTTLLQSASPYSLHEDLIVPPHTTLTVQEGVTLHLPAHGNLRIQGVLKIEGTAAAPVHIIGRNHARWGGLSFENPTGTSTLSHLILRGATRGANPILYPYALSGLNASLVIDHLDIDESEGPVFCRGGSLILRQSRLHTPYTGDCLNVKGGSAETYDCLFIGNNAPDTDAIDYDGVVNGVISGCHIRQFQGPNGDGIDIGEACSNVLIEGNLIYFNSDKGISVGQASTVTLRKNLIVGCVLGVGIKDAGSVATIDQNTFVNCNTGVDVYEKNFGDGGGSAVITHTIFSKCSILPVQADAFSTAVTSYSLSDTVALSGTGNLLASPMFIDAENLNFQLQPDSPAIDAGDPGHAPDADGSRSDIGAYYTYDPAHYPWTPSTTVVIDEVLAHSGPDTPDWIELYNRLSQAVDIGGWFLSDSSLDLRKYRIPDGTTLPAGGRIVFNENQHFGTTSQDPGRLTPFALSNTGETLHLSAAVNNELTGYQHQEEFGPSLPDESLGNYYKSSTDSWNFVALLSPTPGLANSAPRVGPVTISEIMFDPEGNPDAEYFELVNISTESVSLYDETRAAAWKITQGLDYEFPSTPPVVMSPGERILLVKNLAQFQAAYAAPNHLRILEWTSGRLSNNGETLQLSRPAALDEAGIRQFARVDRVAYGTSAPWPAAGAGRSLQRIAVGAYGNDPANWEVAAPSPGADSPLHDFASWVASTGLTQSDQEPTADPDLDGVPNGLEFALGGHPLSADSSPAITVVTGTTEALVSFRVRTDRTGINVILESSPNLQPGSWTGVPTVVSPPADNFQTHTGRIAADSTSAFFRLRAN